MASITDLLSEVDALLGDADNLGVPQSSVQSVSPTLPKIPGLESDVDIQPTSVTLNRPHFTSSPPEISIPTHKSPLKEAEVSRSNTSSEAPQSPSNSSTHQQACSNQTNETQVHRSSPSPSGSPSYSPIETPQACRPSFYFDTFSFSDHSQPNSSSPKQSNNAHARAVSHPLPHFESNDDWLGPKSPVNSASTLPPTNNYSSPHTRAVSHPLPHFDSHDDWLGPKPVASAADHSAIPQRTDNQSNNVPFVESSPQHNAKDANSSYLNPITQDHQAPQAIQEATFLHTSISHITASPNKAKCAVISPKLEAVSEHPEASDSFHYFGDNDDNDDWLNTRSLTAAIVPPARIQTRSAPVLPSQAALAYFASTEESDDWLSSPPEPNHIQTKPCVTTSVSSEAEFFAQLSNSPSLKTVSAPTFSFEMDGEFETEREQVNASRQLTEQAVTTSGSTVSETSRVSSPSFVEAQFEQAESLEPNAPDSAPIPLTTTVTTLPTDTTVGGIYLDADEDLLLHPIQTVSSPHSRQQLFDDLTADLDQNTISELEPQPEPVSYSQVENHNTNLYDPSACESSGIAKNVSVIDERVQFFDSLSQHNSPVKAPISCSEFAEADLFDSAISEEHLSHHSSPHSSSNQLSHNDHSGIAEDLMLSVEQQHISESDINPTDEHTSFFDGLGGSLTDTNDTGFFEDTGQTQAIECATTNLFDTSGNTWLGNHKHTSESPILANPTLSSAVDLPQPLPVRHSLIATQSTRIATSHLHFDIDRMSDSVSPGSVNSVGHFGPVNTSPYAHISAPYATYPPQKIEVQSPTRTFSPPPPHPVISFGFGGVLVVAFPRIADPTKTCSSTTLATNTVRIDKVMNCIQYSPYACSISRFCGPLTKNTPMSDLQKFIGEISQSLGSEDVEESHPENYRLLWQLLLLMAGNYGSLRGRDNAAKVGSDLAISQLLCEESQVGEWINLDTTPVPHTQRSKLPSERQSGDQSSQAVEQIERLVISGKLSDACGIAVNHQLWSHALLLASHSSPELYRQILCKFAVSSLPEGSPLQSLYYLYAGQVQELFRPLQTSGMMSGPASSISSTMNGKSPGLIQNWRKNVAIILSNPTPNDRGVLRSIGDLLWTGFKQVSAAHACYLLAEEPIEGEHQSRMVLIGADHRARVRTFWTPEAIQRTEIFEYAKTRGNSQYSLPSFQIYKFVYACMLADIGMMEQALKYCNVLSKSLKNERSVSNMIFLESFSLFDDRVRQFMDSAKSTMGSQVLKKFTSVLDVGLGYILNSSPRESSQTSMTHTQSTSCITGIQSVVSSSTPSPVQFRSNTPTTALSHNSTPTNLKQSLLTAPPNASFGPTQLPHNLSQNQLPAFNNVPIQQPTPGMEQSVSQHFVAPGVSVTQPPVTNQSTIPSSTCEVPTCSTAKDESEIDLSRSKSGGFGAILSGVANLIRPKQPTRKEANLQQDNQYYFDESKGQWGTEDVPQEPDKVDEPLAPPPTTTQMKEKLKEFAARQAENSTPDLPNKPLNPFSRSGSSVNQRYALGHDAAAVSQPPTPATMMRPLFNRSNLTRMNMMRPVSAPPQLSPGHPTGMAPPDWSHSDTASPPNLPAPVQPHSHSLSQSERSSLSSSPPVGTQALSNSQGPTLPPRSFGRTQLPSIRVPRAAQTPAVARPIVPRSLMSQ